MAKDELPIPTPDAPNALAEQVEAMARRLQAIEDELKDMPKPRDMRYEMPIFAFATDKYFKHQLDGGQLTLQLNVKQLQRDFAGGLGGGGGGGSGIVWAGHFQITSSTPTGIVDARGNAQQWVYQGSQVSKGPSGYGNVAWLPTANGYAGEIRNMCENGNSGIGTADNGVNFDAADFPEGFEMIPIVNGDVVPFFFVVNSDGNQEAWFDRCNAVDGLCSGSFA